MESDGREAVGPGWGWVQCSRGWGTFSVPVQNSSDKRTAYKATSFPRQSTTSILTEAYECLFVTLQFQQLIVLQQ